LHAAAITSKPDAGGPGCGIFWHVCEKGFWAKSSGKVHALQPKSGPKMSPKRVAGVQGVQVVAFRVACMSLVVCHGGHAAP
jgi:hypothetical protein